MLRSSVNWKRQYKESITEDYMILQRLRWAVYLERIRNSNGGQITGNRKGKDRRIVGWTTYRRSL